MSKKESALRAGGPGDANAITFQDGYENTTAGLDTQDASARSETEKRRRIVAYHDYRRRQSRRGYSLDAARFAELKRLADARFRSEYRLHGILPDAAMFERFVRIACHHASELDVRRWLGRSWPGILHDDEATRIIDAAYKRRRRWSLDHVADELGVTREERDALGLIRIGATDFRKADRDEERRRRDRERQRAKRAARNAANPPKVPLTKSQPWLAFGWCRRTWERHGKPDVALAPRFAATGVRNTSSYNADATCGTGSVTCANGATKTDRPSIEVAKPWVAEGISRSAWYRRRAAPKAAKPKAVNQAKLKRPAPAKVPARPDTIVILIERMRAVAARNTAISDHLARRSRPLIAMVRAMPTFPTPNRRPETNAA